MSRTGGKSNAVVARLVVTSALVIVILVIDQALKLWVKTSMTLGESIRVFDWFYISFVENDGMAYGFSVGSKLILSLIRLVAVAFLTYFIYKQSRKEACWGLLITLTLILAGAAGNLIDCMFYGWGFEASSYRHVSEWVGLGNGYSTFLMGKVVDMLYFPMIHATWPEWMPFWGGEPFVFFSPVFNFADTAICTGVAVLALFYYDDYSAYFQPKGEENQNAG